MTWWEWALIAWPIPSLTFGALAVALDLHDRKARR